MAEQSRGTWNRIRHAANIASCGQTITLCADVEIILGSD